MASKAIYSEVVELVLNIDKYKDRINDAAQDLSSLKTKVEAAKDWNFKLAVGPYRASINEAIELQKRWQDELSRTNRLLKEQRTGIATGSELNELARSIYAKTPGQRRMASGGNYDASKAAADEINRQLAAQDARRSAFGSFLSAQAGARNTGDPLTATNIHNAEELAARKRELAADVAERERAEQRRNHEAYVDDLRKQDRLHANYTEAQAKLDGQMAERKQQLRNEHNKRIQQSADAEARHQRTLMDFDAKRNKDITGFFSKQAQSLNYLSNFERSEALKRRIEYHELLALETQRLQLVRQREAAERAAENAALRASKRATLEEHQLLKGTAGYKVGRIASGARVGAGLDIAAGAAFGLGATNLGGMLYMMERFSYASGIGQKNLGDLLQKLHLVKLTGEGSAASIQLLGNNIIKLGGAVAAIAAPIGTMFAGNKLDNAIANMSTLLADTSVNGREFAGMMDDAAVAAARLNSSFGLGLVETVNGFKTALSTGIEAGQLEEFGRVAATVTKGLGTTFDDAVGILTTFKDSYNLQVGDMTEISDVLFNAINVGKFQVDDLRNNIGRVVTSAAEAGVGFKDMSAGLATLTRVGLSTSQSITSLNRFIQAIVNPTDQARALFDKLGLATGHAAFKTQTLMQYLQKLKMAVGDNADLMGELFTTEQGRRGAIGLTTNLGLTGEIRTAMDDVGTATIAANRAMDTFSQNFGKIFSTIWDVVQLIGRDLLQVANDVFFPGGPLGADSMTNLKTIVELVGMGIKAVGTALITVAGVGANALSVLVNGFGGLQKMIGGVLTLSWETFTSGTKDISNSVYNLGQSFGNGVGGMVETMQLSLKRIGELAIGGVKSVGEETATLVETGGKAVASMFGDDAVSAIASFASKTVNEYDKIKAKIDEVRLAQAKLAFEAANPKPTSGRPDIGAVPYAPTQVDFYRRIGIGGDMRRKYGGFSEDFIKNRISSAGGLDPNDPAIIDAEQRLQKERLRIAEEAAAARAKSEAEAYAKAWEAEAKRLGLGHLLPKTGADGGVAAKDQDKLDKLSKLMGILSDVKEGRGRTITDTITGYVFGGSNSGATSGTATHTVTRNATTEEQLAEARKLYSELADYYKNFKDAMTENDRKYYEDALKIADAGIKEQTKKQEEATAKRYKDEYDNALKIHNLKMSAFEKESKRLTALLEKYEDFFTKLAERRTDRELARMSPKQRYRRTREDIEQGTSALEGIKDPKVALDAANRILKRIDEFMSQGAAIGKDRHTTRMADDMEAKVEAIMRSKQDSLIKETQTNENNIDNAIAKFKADMAENPVAQAALAQAMIVMKEVVGKAAENGIGVTGDLVQDINISKIDVNLPVREFETMVRDAAREMVLQYLRDKRKGQGTVDTNDTPVGGDNI